MEEAHLDRKEIESFISTLAFVREYAISVASATAGEVVIELPFDDRFSGPPGQFPASMVGTAGDVAAVSSCLSLLPRGWAVATLDSFRGARADCHGARLPLACSVFLRRPGKRPPAATRCAARETGYSRRSPRTFAHDA